MHDAILLEATVAGALLHMALQIYFHTCMDSLKLHAHAPTSHQRVKMGSSNFLKARLAVFMS